MTKIKVIVTGHGHYASGMRDAIEMIVGNPRHMTFIDFSSDDSEDDLRERFIQEVNTAGGKDIVFLTNLLGGTPFSVAAVLTQTNSHISIVAGGNLASLLETLFKDYPSGRAYAEDIVHITKNAASVLPQ